MLFARGGDQSARLTSLIAGLLDEMAEDWVACSDWLVAVSSEVEVHAAFCLAWSEEESLG